MLYKTNRFFLSLSVKTNAFLCKEFMNENIKQYFNLAIQTLYVGVRIFSVLHQLDNVQITFRTVLLLFPHFLSRFRVLEIGTRPPCKTSWPSDPIYRHFNGQMSEGSESPSRTLKKDATQEEPHRAVPKKSIGCLAELLRLL